MNLKVKTDQLTARDYFQFLTGVDGETLIESVLSACRIWKINMYRFWIYIQQLPMSGNLIWSFWTCHFTERLLTHAILSWLKAVFTSPETTANSKCICRETVWKSNVLFGTMLENHSDWTRYGDSEENGIGVSFKCFFQAIVYTVYSKLKISFYYFWSTASIWVYVCVCVCNSSQV